MKREINTRRAMPNLEIPVLASFFCMLRLGKHHLTMPLSFIRRFSQRNKLRRTTAATRLAQRAADLRALAARAHLAARELRELAGIEDVYLGPGRSRSARFIGDDDELASGLAARLGRPDGRYWFLGRDGRFYVSETHALGRGSDLVAVEKDALEVPEGLEGLAWVYRQLCD